jgi:hypothetical protein
MLSTLLVEYSSRSACQVCWEHVNSMDDVDRLLEEEEDALLDEQPDVLELPEGADALGAEPVDEASWVRPPLGAINVETDDVGAWPFHPSVYI